MPTYQYICNNCKYEFEKSQSIISEPLKRCPKCHKDALKKVISGGVGVIFKGSGFYVTDYKKHDSGLKKRKEINQDTQKSESKELKPKQETKDKKSNS